MNITTERLWLQKGWQLFQGYLKQNRVPHALLITGQKGIGKSELAKQFTYSLLCNQPQNNSLHCGQCQSCLLLTANTHPDFCLIQPEEDKQSISINQIRAVVSDTYLKPQFDTYRVVIINPADNLTISAANAFLKCLEEPGERTIFLLLTSKPDKLPATIVSRCQKITVVFPERPLIYKYMKEQGIQNNQETLLRLAQGSILSIQEINDQEVLNQRKECFQDWLAVVARKSQPSIIAEKWQKIPEAILINWLLSWVSDLIKNSFITKPEYLTNQDLVKYLQELSQQLDLKELFTLYDKLLLNRKLLASQLNFQIVLEEILVQWQQLNRSY